MKNVYLYIENQNQGRITTTSFRRDTAFQIESNDSYKKIQDILRRKDINFDFLADQSLKTNDFVIVSNVTPFVRNNLLSNLLLIKKKVTNKNRGFLNLRTLVKSHPDVTFIPYLWESQVAEEQNWDFSILDNFKKVATWNSDLINSNPEKYFLLNLQAGPLMNNISSHPKSFEDKDYLLTVICNYKQNANEFSGYAYRNKVIDWYASNFPNSIRVFGGGWDLAISKFNSEQRKLYEKIYGGTVESKISVIQNSKFYLCIENCTTQDGYVTEKIFDAIKAATVPIYMGPQNVNEIIPQNAYVDLRMFAGDYSSLNRYISEMSKKRYNQIRNAGLKYLESNEFEPSSIADQIVQLISL